MKILVFTEGTVLMPSSAQGKTREEILQQAAENKPSFADFRSYIPNGNAVSLLKMWKKQGAQIYYLTSRETPKEIDDIKYVLEKFNFPDRNNLVYRENNEAYKDVAERVLPDILIEDDCESIGGEIEMTYPHIDSAIQAKIKSIVVKEFAGIDHLPGDVNLL